MSEPALHVVFRGTVCPSVRVKFGESVTQLDLASLQFDSFHSSLSSHL